MILFVAILIGYWAILMYVPSPDSKAGDLSIETNLAGYLDRHYLPGKIYKSFYGFGDNEGLLSTIPAVATALLGVLAGQWLLSSRGRLAKGPRPGGRGTGLPGRRHLVGTRISDHQNPLDQHLRSDRGRLESALARTLLHDHRRAQVPRLGIFLRRHRRQRDHDLCCDGILFPLRRSLTTFLGGVARLTGSFGPVVVPIGTMALEWLFLLHLYRNKIFLRV